MSAEDEGDAQAAAEARAEQAAELAEFDEAYAAHNDGSQVRDWNIEICLQTIIRINYVYYLFIYYM